MRPVALLGGMLTGVVALGFLQGAVFLTIGTLMGVDVSSGFFGMVVIVLLTVLVALGFGGIGAILAIRTGSVEGIRSLVITGWDPQALILGFGFALAIVVVAIGGAAASLKTTMT